MNPAVSPARVAAILAVAAAALAAPARAQQGEGGQENGPDRPSVILDLDGAARPAGLAARATGSIGVDGRLDESAWAAAPVIDRFVQQKPTPGAPASELTEVRILYDDEHLYIGAEMHDSDPSALVIPTLQRDPNTRDGDAFGFTLDTFHDGKSSFAYFINPGGAVRDSQTSDDGRVSNAAWESAHQLRTRIHEGGWTVEMAIPWSTLRFEGGQDAQVWGLNLLRRIRRKNEDATWAPMDRRWQLYVMSRAGTLAGLDGIEPGRNLSVKPFVLTSRPSGDLRPDEGTELDAGGDLKYGLTPGMTLDLTVNTDFSQVEVDQQQVNLTRFSLFFPEKREFFLENAGIFQFGDQGQYNQRNGATDRDFTLFHSRRIGLTPAGAPLPILGGARVSGTAGPLSVGVLNMQTRGQEEFLPENFTVARLRGEAAPGLTAGAIFVNRTTTSGTGADNQSYGVDASWQALGDYLLVQSYLAASQGASADGTPLDRAMAGRLSVAWRDPLWEVEALYRRFDDDFDPGAGFVRRRGVRHGYGTVGISPQVGWGPLQEVNPYVEGHYFADLDGLLETRELGGGLDLDLRDGATASVSVTDRFERVRAPFSVRGATVDAGAYDFVEGRVSYDASRARAVSGRVNVGGGGYFGGERLSVGGSVLGRIGYRALLDLSAEHNRIELPGQAPVTADVYGAKLDAFFSTRLLTSAFVQYNEATQELVTNVRLNWIHAPLSDLYVVLTERRDTAGDRVLERVLSLKVTRLVSF
ncbi:MAG: carbohydrate binding family 9 domain-containing protein [Gemmatimonadetes bacterium]|nr:carbohydrate binding family 9 domain-containing protein [Gemmatimonadota bacterium]